VNIIPPFLLLGEEEGGARYILEVLFEVSFLGV
jgi:hypothetical protein